eukprot:2521037-Pleurochrysis_carterae.AAC.2
MQGPALPPIHMKTRALMAVRNLRAGPAVRLVRDDQGCKGRHREAAVPRGDGGAGAFCSTPSVLSIRPRPLSPVFRLRVSAGRRVLLTKASCLSSLTHHRADMSPFSTGRVPTRASSPPYRLHCPTAHLNCARYVK